MNGAIYFVQMGRGYGRQRVPVIDVGVVGGGRVVHILVSKLEDVPRPLCSRKGETSEIIVGVDPRAVRVDGIPVCESCRERLGQIPSVEYLRDIELAEAS